MKMFILTHISKDIEEDSFENGCTGERRCLIDDRVDRKFKTFQELLQFLNDSFGLPNEAKEYGAMEEQNGRLTLQRNECGNGDQLEGYKMERWKEGKEKAYLADWSFFIEIGDITDMTTADMVKEGVQQI